MNKPIRLVPSSDFLRLYFAENEKSGGVSGVHLCTLECCTNEVNGNSTDYGAVSARLKKCLPSITTSFTWRMTAWIYTGSIILKQSVSDLCGNVTPNEVYFADQLAKLADGKIVVAFTIDFDANDPSRQWLFVVV